MSEIAPFARAVCDGVRGAGSRHVVYVPDNPLDQVIRGLAPDVRTILATREEEAVGIAAGLYLGGARPTVMMQSSGLGNAVNALASLVLPYQVPLLLVISMRGEPGEWNAAQVPMGRATAPILDALGIRAVEIPDYAVEIPDCSVVADRLAVQIPDYAVQIPDYAVQIPDYAVQIPDYEAAAETVHLAGRLAFDTRMPVACLLPRRLTAPRPGGAR